MKITYVEPIVVAWPPFENSFWTSLNRIGQVSELVVLVHTDEGITGIGEAHGGSMHTSTTLVSLTSPAQVQRSQTY